MASLNKLVFLLEPDEAVRSAITSSLQQRGWIVMAYALAADLVANLEEHSPRVLICESRMPDMSARAIFSNCKNNNVPVIFLGHGREIQAAVDLMRMGASDFLEKPFPQERLIELLDNLETEPASISS